MGKDRKPDGVSTYPADEHDLDSYRHASHALSQLRAPILLHASNPHERLFVAAFDGTGNSLYKDAPENRTNVALIYQQIEAGRKRGITHISAAYVEGPGTQDDLIRRTKDQITGESFEPRVEEMYQLLIKQAKRWIDEDPNAKISVAITGFSRGGEQGAAFARLLHERGIQDALGAVYKGGSDGMITHVEFTKPALVQPGQTAQAIGLFDPVGTGEPRQHNRTLPPSVLAGFQITAEDERRDQFKSTNIIDPGFSEGRRFLNVTVGGAHCNIGAGYRLNGLSIRSGNAMIDFFNGLSDRPYLEKTAEPTDPKLNVVHRSEEGIRLLYTTQHYERNGGRARIEQVDLPAMCRNGIKRNCWNKDPHDPVLDGRFDHRNVPIAPPPVPPLPDAKRREPHAAIDGEVQRGNPAAQPHPGQQSMQATHADYPLFAALRRQLPQELSDDVVAHAMVQAKQGGISRESQLNQAVLHNGHVFIVGNTPGDRAKVDVSGPVPPMDETLRRSQTIDQQVLAQQDAWDRQRQQTASHNL